MKDLIEKHLQMSRKKKVELADYFKITRAGLDYKIKNDSWDIEELKSLAIFFETDVDEFLPKTEKKNDASMWEFAKAQLEKRIEELSSALNDARYTIQLQKRLLGENGNFNFLSSVSHVNGGRRIAMMKVIRTNPAHISADSGSLRNF